MKVTIVVGLLFIFVQELHTKRTPFVEMSESSKDLRAMEVKSLLSNYVGFKQSCNDLVDFVMNGEDSKAGLVFAKKLFASKTNTSESDWERIFLGDKTLFTADERVRINSIPKNDDSELREREMLKILAMSRMSKEDATYVIQLHNSIHHSTNDPIAMAQSMVGVISVCSEQSYENVLSWFPEMFEELHSTDALYNNLSGDNEKFI